MDRSPLDPSCGLPLIMMMEAAYCRQGDLYFFDPQMCDP